jgi:O-antigen/teichoic acid export membrane protein
VITRLDQTLMPTLSGARQLGFYAVAVSVSEIPLFMSIAVRDVVLTASTARADFRLVADAARAVLLSQIVLAAAAALVAPWLVPWVFGAQFAGSVPSVLVLLFGGALGSAGSVLNQGLLSLNAPLIRSLTLAATAVVAIVTLLVLAPEFGALGASLASACAYVSSSLLNALAFSKKAGVSVRDCLVPRPADGQRVASLVAATTTRLRRGRKNPLKR